MLPAVAALIGALLSFSVQPLVGKLLLPRFGGGSAVWTVCLLFFQTGLLLGYAHAHLLILRQPLRRGVVLHLGLLLAGLATLPLGLAALPVDWGAAVQSDPTVGILWALAGGVGLPYVALAATAPLIQAWQARLGGAVAGDASAGPWRLYAWSNVGSLVGLLGWPTLVEPFVGAQAQRLVWSAGYAGFLVVLGACALRVWRAAPALGAVPALGALPALVAVPANTPTEPVAALASSGDAAHLGDLDGVGLGSEPEPPPEGAPRRGDGVLWVALTAVSAALLSATTDRLTEDVAAGPLLWVLPLALYLLSYIVVFGRAQAGRRGRWSLLFAVAAVGVWWVLNRGQRASLPAQVLGYNFGLFVACMALHGELVRLRPPAARLTAFYLATALGGVIGGLSVAVLAPRLLSQRLDLQVALVAAGGLLWFAAWRQRPREAWRRVAGVAWAAPLVLLAGLAGLFAWDAWTWQRDLLALERGFFGVVAVRDDLEMVGGPARKMLHGRIMHGRQSKAEPRRPVAYYGPRSGLGQYFSHGAQDPPRRVAVLGLGVGTIAAFGRCGDHLDFVEIDPLVERVARSWFSYLADTCASTRVVIADGRLALEAGGALAAVGPEGPQAAYDLIVLDAFTGDAVPAHLLTAEAFEVYRARLVSGGVIAVNVSNRHLDLRPVVRAQAAAWGWVLAEVTSLAEPERQLSRARWMLLSTDEALRTHIHLQGELDRVSLQTERRRWTDDFAPWLGLLRAFR